MAEARLKHGRELEKGFSDTAAYMSSSTFGRNAGQNDDSGRIEIVKRRKHSRVAEGAEDIIFLSLQLGFFSYYECNRPTTPALQRPWSSTRFTPAGNWTTLAPSLSAGWFAWSLKTFKPNRNYGALLCAHGTIVSFADNATSANLLIFLPIPFIGFSHRMKSTARHSGSLTSRTTWRSSRQSPMPRQPTPSKFGLSVVRCGLSFARTLSVFVWALPPHLRTSSICWPKLSQADGLLSLLVHPRVLSSLRHIIFPLSYIFFHIACLLHSLIREYECAPHNALPFSLPFLLSIVTHPSLFIYCTHFSFN